MNTILILVGAVLLVTLDFAHSHEPSMPSACSTIKGITYLSVPSEDFIKRGKVIRKGAAFDVDVRAIRKTTLDYAKKVAGVKGNLHISSIDLVSFGDLDDGLWCFRISLVDSAKNILQILVNTKGEVWPHGVRHDPFDITHDRAKH